MFNPPFSTDRAKSANESVMPLVTNHGATSIVPNRLPVSRAASRKKKLDNTNIMPGDPQPPNEPKHHQLTSDEDMRHLFQEEFEISVGDVFSELVMTTLEQLEDNGIAVRLRLLDIQIYK